MRLIRFVVVAIAASACAFAQPFLEHFEFTMPEGMDLDTSLVVGPFEKAGVRGRLMVLDGHLSFEDGTRFRPVGTTIQVGGVFPDSAKAIAIAKRLRALGITCVRLANFDYAFYKPISILADGNSTLESGLDADQMKRFDWFMYQLREHGIYYAFTFHGYWQPRPGDGVMDSTGYVPRVPIIFESRIQEIHRGIIKLLLTHYNPFTANAYKDDPALAFVIAGEDLTVMAYWMYSKDIVPSNPSSGTTGMGQNHIRYIDSLFNARLKAKGLNTDAKLNAAWRTTPSNTTEMVRAGGFEDPFDPSWTLGVNSQNGAQAIMQYSETDKKEGTQSGRVRIGSLDRNKNAGGIYLYQVLPGMKRLHRYIISMWVKSEQSVPSRRLNIVFHNPAYPYNSYGFQQTVTITNQWQKLDFPFVSSATDTTSAALQLQMGMDSGDVYFDAISLKEIGFEGLKPGESISTNSIRRHILQDQSISPARAQEEFEFYRDQYSTMMSNVLKCVRDTIMSNVLMCPSLRTFTNLELQMVKQYDLFSNNDQLRTSMTPSVAETNNNPLFQATQYDLSNKPLVLFNTGIQYPRWYQPEMAVVTPAYAGLHDWDGVFFSVFASTPRVGNIKADSLSYWELFDKPFILTMLPGISNALRSFDVKPSQKVVQISNNAETMTYPAFHATMPYGLSVYTDSRLPLFRRVEVMPNIAAQETFLPHLEVPILSAGNIVDPSGLNAENEQIFLDASQYIMRVLTPKYMAVTGVLQGKIVTEEGLIVEQTSDGYYTSVVLSSLTDKPVVESPTNMLVIGSRGLNDGAVMNEDYSNLTVWGQGPMQIEGRSVRITLTAPMFDTCYVTALGNDARPKGTPQIITRSPTGRFSIAVSTVASKSPWFKVEFKSATTNVETEWSASAVSVSPNPASDYVWVSAPQFSTVNIVDLFGNIVAAAETTEATGVKIATSNLAAGQYIVQVTNKAKVFASALTVVR